MGTETSRYIILNGIKRVHDTSAYVRETTYLMSAQKSTRNKTAKINNEERFASEIVRNISAENRHGKSRIFLKRPM